MHSIKGGVAVVHSIKGGVTVVHFFKDIPVRIAGHVPGDGCHVLEKTFVRNTSRVGEWEDAAPCAAFGGLPAHRVRYCAAFLEDVPAQTGKYRG